MIEWLRRVDPKKVYLRALEHEWTYGETVAEVQRRMTTQPTVVRPRLDPGSIFDVLAGLSGGGLTVVAAEGQAGVDSGSGLVVYTSGSSGPPKGVRLTLSNLEAAARGSAGHLGHGVEDDWLLAMPLHHVGGLSIVVRQAHTGGSITMLPGFEPDSFSRALHGTVTMASVVPTMLRRLLALGPYQGLRAVLVGGGPIPEGLLEEGAAVGLPVLPTYGMTETFGQIATLRPGDPLERKVHPLPGVSLRIETEGRIAVRGDQVSPGYAGQPDRSDPWFVTSDIGALDDDGALRVLGRSDSVVVTGGENVSPEQVETVISGHPGVDDVVVAGVPDPEWGHRLVAVYTGTAGESDLAAWVGDRLEGFMVPKDWRRVAQLPRTSIGKPDRVAASRLWAGGGG